MNPDQAIKAPLSVQAKTFIATVFGAAATTLIKGLDVSAYQINVPWAVLVAHGLQFAIIKGDQLTATDNHIALARAAGVPLVGEYFWDDPTISAQAQIDAFAADIREHNPDFIFLDVEQYWAYWSDYWDYLAGKIPQASVRRKSPQAISDHVWFTLTGLQRLFPDLRIGIYTGTWFINAYALPMVPWMGQWSLWMAHYYTNTLTYVTWDQYAALPPQPFTVWMPNSSLQWILWQYTSTVITPAKNERWDQNVFKGTLEEMKVWCGKVSPPPLPLTWAQAIDEWARGDPVRPFGGPKP